MRYTVIWTRSALDTLATLWTSSTDRRSVNNAIEEVDRLLGNGPDRRGQDFYGDRLLVVDPLWVTSQVQEDDRAVEVLDIWYR